MRPMLYHIGNHEMADTLTEEQLALSDYQRRSPHTAINILRTSQLNAASGAKSIVDLDVGNGVLEKASGITTYTRNAIRLANTGKEALDTALQADMEMGL
uniref:Uncharacterized protein n=1 Tax=Attheya septentrionalis TaxID=420275 RepID=A0A7S2XT47_9STRA